MSVGVCLSRHVGAAVLRHHLVAIGTGPLGTWVPTALTLERGKAVENVQWFVFKFARKSAMKPGKQKLSFCRSR